MEVEEGGREKKTQLGNLRLNQIQIFNCKASATSPVQATQIYSQSAVVKQVSQIEQLGKLPCLAHSLAGHGRQLVFMYVLV